MRVALPLIAIVFASGASAEEPKRILPDPNVIGDATADSTVCHDRIHQVRDNRGLPELQRKQASPEEPLLIAAVDHQINGCSVLVMRNDTSDIRPIPALPKDPQLIPAR